MRCRAASKPGLDVVYLAIGQPERWAELCRAQLARRRDTHVYIRAWLVYALAVAGSRWGGDGFRGWPHRGCGGNRQPDDRSRWRSLPTVSLSVTQIPSGRLTPSAGVW